MYVLMWHSFFLFQVLCVCQDLFFLGFKSYLMAGFISLENGYALEWIKTLQNLRTNNRFFNLEPKIEGSVVSVEENNIRCLFDKILLDFLKSSQCFRPFPPMLGNGQSVDLLKLYLAVREKGGFETVSESGFWGLIAKDLEFSYLVGTALKLIYSKFLGKFDSWSQKIANEKSLKGVLEDSGLMEVDTEFSDDLSDVLDPKKEDVEFTNPGEKKGCLDTNNAGNLHLFNDCSNKKRKREGYTEMLSWIRNVAKDPCDPKIGLLPERSKWKKYGEEHLWKQVLISREMTCLKRNASSTTTQSPANWAKRPMHPSMYEDSDKVRSSQRVIPIKELNPKKRATSESSSGTHSDLDDDFGKNESIPAGSVFFFLNDREHRKRVSVSPYFQANVPDWTNEPYNSDSKWLGSRVWPLESGERKTHLVERERMGKGRQDSCGCQYQGSVECVRFHVAEKRIRIKLELGSAFSFWKFNKMGEEVALSWTKKDEEIFQGIIRSNPRSMEKCFWDEIVKAFPSKKKGELVSYYFNVFLLQRRSYQNRSTPSNIDSDDDEDSEFGSLIDGFSHETGKSPSSIFYSPKKAQSSA